MLINIWATLTHLGDSYFCGDDQRAAPSMDLVVCDGLRRITKDRQTWMVNPVWLKPGTTGQLLLHSYATIRDARESYLMLITPGFADVLHEVPADLVRTQLTELCRRARAFNKRFVTTLLGTPPGCPTASAQRISEWNGAVKEVTDGAGGAIADLRSIAYEKWGPSGSRALHMPEAGALLVQAVLDSHSQSAQWQARHDS